MGVHLYCMLSRGTDTGVPDGLSGLAGRSVRALALEGVHAWVSDVPRGLPVTIDTVKVHDEVVEAALATGATPVPARYGQRFDNDQSCGDAVARRIVPLRALLTRVAGCVEMTLIVTPSTGRMLRELERDAPEPPPAKDYLNQLRRRERAIAAHGSPSRRLLERIQQAVTPWVKGQTTHEPIVRKLLLTASHLVERGASEAYRAAVARVGVGTNLRVLVVGPRAPYSFCAVRETSRGTHGMNLAD